MEKIEPIDPHPTVLCAVTGTPGVGKKTLCNGLYVDGKKVEHGLRDYIRCFYITKDMIADGFTDERDGKLYYEMREGIYKAAQNLIPENLPYISIIFNANFRDKVQDPNWAEPYIKMAKEAGSKFRHIRCVAPEEMIRERIKARGYERDLIKLDKWEEFIEREPIYVPLPEHSIEIDTTESIEVNIKKALYFMMD